MLKQWKKVASLGLMFAAVTCSGLDNIDVEETSRATLPGKSPLEQLLATSVPFGGEFTGMDITTNTELENQGVEASDIDSVKLKSLTLSIQSPSTGDFTFLDSISFFVEAQGLERKRIATGGPFEAGLRTVGLDVDDVDLKDYAVAESMNITTEVSGERPDEETVVEATVVMTVDANVDGLICGS